MISKHQVVLPVSKKQETISVSVRNNLDGTTDVAFYNHAHPGEALGYKLPAGASGSAFAADLLAAYQRPLTLTAVQLGWWYETVANYDAEPNEEAGRAFDLELRALSAADAGSQIT